MNSNAKNESPSGSTTWTSGNLGSRPNTCAVRSTLASKNPAYLKMASVPRLTASATIKSIDTAEALKAPGVVAVITGKDLEAAGLIRRDVDPVDGRASLISLTDSGRATLARIREARCGILAEALVDMDPDALVTAADALARIAAAVERSQAERPLIIGGKSTAAS